MRQGKSQKINKTGMLRYQRTRKCSLRCKETRPKVGCYSMQLHFSRANDNYHSPSRHTQHTNKPTHMHMALYLISRLHQDIQQVTVLPVCSHDSR